MMMKEQFKFLDMEDDVLEFTLAEMVEMETSFRGMKDTPPSQEFCDNLASKFSFSLYRCGQSSVKWEQVQRWFQDRQRKEVAKSLASPLFLNELVESTKQEVAMASASPLSINDLVESSKKEQEHSVQNMSQKFSVKIRIPSCRRPSLPNLESFIKPKDQIAKDLPELIFEAKSTRDPAWYDVSAFLNYRVLYSGELEARVRFAGFGYSHDEWVNVRKGVRQRSIPLEGSECHKVEVGDYVLCYRETEDAAIYCDAHIVGIERNKHDGDDCSCIFSVRYDYDSAEMLFKRRSFVDMFIHFSNFREKIVDSYEWRLWRYLSAVGLYFRTI